MDGKMLARLGAIIFVAVVLTVTAIEMTRKEEAPAPASLHEPSRDPLREGQRRCQQLGQKAAEDAECMRVWAETRDRFLSRTPTAPAVPDGR